MTKPEMRKIEYGTDRYEESIDFRDKYFRKPQGMNLRDEDLSDDKNTNMYGGYIKDELMATVFYKKLDDETAQIKAVIVDEKYQKQGLGNFLMEYVEEMIKKEGFKKAILHGRVKVQEFYEKLGYESYGEVDIYNTIPHIWMEKEL